MVAVAAAAGLSFLGHLRLPVTSFTSVTHSSFGGERGGGGGDGGEGGGLGLPAAVNA